VRFDVVVQSRTQVAQDAVLEVFEIDVAHRRVEILADRVRRPRRSGKGERRRLHVMDDFPRFGLDLARGHHALEVGVAQHFHGVGRRGLVAAGSSGVVLGLARVEGVPPVARRCEVMALMRYHGRRNALLVRGVERHVYSRRRRTRVPSSSILGR
jgi:hypothetical protein